ncbi:MAG: CAP domain-containing protein [Candidatus Uhrbacteria bacterium]
MRLFPCQFQPIGRRHRTARKLLLPCAIAVISGILALPQMTISAGIAADSMLLRVNAARSENGLQAYTEHPALRDAAQRRAEEILTSSQFAHIRPDGGVFATAITDAGYHYYRAGENLAVDFLLEPALIKAWLDSPSHRRNILSDHYLDIGVGVAAGLLANMPTIVVVELVGEAGSPPGSPQGTTVALPSNLPTV